MRNIVCVTYAVMYDPSTEQPNPINTKSIEPHMYAECAVTKANAREHKSAYTTHTGKYNKFKISPFSIRTYLK